MLSAAAAGSVLTFGRLCVHALRYEYTCSVSSGVIAASTVTASFAAGAWTDSGTPATTNLVATPISFAYDPPVPTLSSTAGASGDDITSTMVSFDLEFPAGKAVSGLTTANLASSVVVSPGTAVVTVEAREAEPARLWAINVALDDGTVDASITVNSIPELLSSPPNGVGLPAAYVLNYKVVTVQYVTSSLGASGSVSTNPMLTFTAQFSSAVTGVTPSAFGITADASFTYTASVATADGNVASTDWVLTVYITAATDGQKAVTVAALPAGAAGIVPINAAGSNGAYTLEYVAAFVG